MDTRTWAATTHGFNRVPFYKTPGSIAPKRKKEKRFRHASKFATHPLLLCPYARSAHIIRHELYLGIGVGDPH